MMEEDFRGGGGGGRHGSGSTKSIPSCLNILPGKFCLRLVVTVVVLEDGGSIKDACLLACMAAWKDTKLPVLGKDVKEVNGKMYWTDNWFHKNEINSDNDDGYISDDPSSNRMTVDSDDDNDGNDQRNFRVSLTMGVWVHPTDRTTFILDPSAAEEIRLGGDELTVTTEIGNEDNIQIEYAGRIPLTATDLAFISKLVKAHGEDVTKMLLC
jgi:exosome complex RNA-binding protein Rrp42 (RNase PH superfamily)